MANLIDYIKWRGDLDFDASPFNPVDNLILSKLSYMSFELKKEPVTLSELAVNYLESNKSKLGLLLTGEFDLLLELAGISKRYQSVLIIDQKEIINEAIELQFSATTFMISDQEMYLAYRGTDDTLVGWKEDFKMSFLDVVPAQVEALHYFETIALKYPQMTYYLGGHSKGGNLAIYAGAHANELIQDQIIKIYNNDGPGFKKNLMAVKGYQSVSKKILTLMPQSSIVGMLLEHEESYLVVKSTQKGVLQHDGFSWQVSGPDFEYLSQVTPESILVDTTLRNILNSMTLEQRASFTNILFEIITVNENRTLIDIKADGLKSIHAMIKNYKQLDKDTKKAIFDTTTLFFGEGLRSFKEVKNADQWHKKSLLFRTAAQSKIGKYISKND